MNNITNIILDKLKSETTLTYEIVGDKGHHWKINDNFLCITDENGIVYYKENDEMIKIQLSSNNVHTFLKEIMQAQNDYFNKIKSLEELYKYIEVKNDPVQTKRTKRTKRTNRNGLMRLYNDKYLLKHKVTNKLIYGTVDELFIDLNIPLNQKCHISNMIDTVLGNNYYKDKVYFVHGYQCISDKNHPHIVYNKKTGKFKIGLNKITNIDNYMLIHDTNAKKEEKGVIHVMYNEDKNEIISGTAKELAKLLHSDVHKVIYRNRNSVLGYIYVGQLKDKNNIPNVNIVLNNDKKVMRNKQLELQF